MPDKDYRPRNTAPRDGDLADAYRPREGVEAGQVRDLGSPVTFDSDDNMRDFRPQVVDEEEGPDPKDLSARDFAPLLPFEDETTADVSSVEKENLAPAAKVSTPPRVPGPSTQTS